MRGRPACPLKENFKLILVQNLGKDQAKVHGILSKMARREFSIFINFSDTYTCSYVM